MKRILVGRGAVVIHGLLVAGLLGVLPHSAQAQRRGRGNGGPPTLGLTNGFMDLDTPDFTVQLVKDSQTIAALKPKAGTDSFDFTPNDQLQVRQADHFYHLGDLTLRLREGDTGEWKPYSTAAARKPVTALPVSGSTLASADLTPTLAEDCPLQVTRSWGVEDGRLVLKFEVKNKSDHPVTIGSLGMPLIFNNYLTDRSRKDVHEKCAFSDPAINEDGGYVQVTRLNGKGPSLLVVPEGKTPLEAYNPILDRQNSPALRVFADATPLSQTFEGFYEWLACSRAYAENEWKNVEEWNAATSQTLTPGASRVYGLKFLVAPDIRAIEKTLAANGRPVASGVPGFILPMDIDGRLFLKYGKAVDSTEVEPKGAITLSEDKAAPTGWKSYTLHGKTWGRARLTVNYTDGTKQTLSYYITKPAVEAFADVGNFLFTKAWFTDTNDPFHRAPSIMNYDHKNGKIVLQDALSWKAGLEDEGGSGGWVTAAMKLMGDPTPAEVKKFEEFVDGVLWGGIQYKEDAPNNGPKKYTVVNSMFYYDHDVTNFDYAITNWNTGDWTKWNKQRALTGGRDRPRAYNYPHVVAAYWAMYHIARNHPGLVTNHPWDWYLDQAYQTVRAVSSGQVGYLNVGLMEGDVFVYLLEDMKREGWTDKATEIETAMKRRVEGQRGWAHDPYPFGSEMAWDSTGQEEVFAWTKYFGHNDTAQLCLDSILGYMPSIPNWGYDGNARRYWDFYFGDAPGGHQERQIHHYGSGINAVPLLSQYRDTPDDLYLLSLGYAGHLGALSAIDKDGFPSPAFHSWPSLMHWDTYIGDAGPNFYSHAVDSATYVVNHPEFGWLAYGGNIKSDAGKVTVTPLDEFRSRVYVAPAGLWLTLDAGNFQSVEYNPATHGVRVELAKADKFTPDALLRIEQPAKVAGVGAYEPGGQLKTERGGFVVPLKSSATWVELTAK